MSTKSKIKRAGLTLSLVTIGWLLESGLAQAQGEPLVVEVGKTVERNVAYARGWSCDDPSLVQAEVVTRGDHNVWVVTGRNTGATVCRIGSDPYAISYVFSIRVIPPNGAKNEIRKSQ